MKGIEFDSLNEEVFNGLNSEDTITIYELSRVFSRQPFELKKDTLKLARYLIEPRKEPMIVLNKLREEKVKEIQLKNTIGEYIILDKEEKKKSWEVILEVSLNVHNRNSKARWESLRSY